MFTLYQNGTDKGYHHLSGHDMNKMKLVRVNTAIFKTLKHIKKHVKVCQTKRVFYENVLKWHFAEISRCSHDPLM